ncbi:MAG: PEP-CTERM system TPR-repeat protein PrsT [Burkholderiales bacterium]|nr:PEP-CTERM system TPR-repeat protein PrsT [Burkholderiales bacterium]
MRVLSLALVVGMLVTACGNQPSESELIQSAQEKLHKSDYKAAVLQLKNALASNPRSGEARRLYGQVLLALGDGAAAAVELERARELGESRDLVLPDLALALLRSGRAAQVTTEFDGLTLDGKAADAQLKAVVADAWRAQGNTELGARAVQEALDSDPKNLLARLLNVRLIAGRGDLEAALAETRSVAADNPRSHEAQNLLGQLLLYTKQDLEGAQAAFEKALAAMPTYLPSHSGLIDIALSQNDLTQLKSRVAGLKKALPDSFAAQFYDVQLALATEDLTRAKEGAERLMQLAPESTSVLLLSGAIDLQLGSLLRAESALTKALQQAPASVAARRLLAQTYVRSGQAQRAVNVLQPLLTMHSPGPEVLSMAAEANLQLGHVDAAEKLYAQAAKANPGNTTAQTAVALIQIAKGRVDSGVAQLESVAATDPTAYADLALIATRLRRNEPDAALAVIERVKKKLPASAVPYLLQGRIHAGRKDAVTARRSYEKALEIDPAYFPALLQLTTLDWADNKPDDAARRVQAFLDKAPGHSKALLLLAECKRRTGAAATDIAATLAAAVRADRNDEAAHLALINHFAVQRDFTSARQAVQDAAAALPDSTALLDAAGRVQLLAGDAQQAVNTFRKLSSGQPTQVRPLLGLAEAYMSANDVASATTVLRKALDLDPKSLPAQIALARAAMMGGRFDDALRVAQTVRQIQPKDPAGWLIEADVHIAKRRWNAAATALEGALSKGANSGLSARLYLMLLNAGRDAEAERLGAGMLNELPAGSPALIELGLASLAKKKYVAAEAQFSKALSGNPEDPLVLNNYAMALAMQGKPEALQYARKANRLRPEHPGIMDTLALASALNNQKEEALVWQRKALTASNGAPIYRLGLARLLIRFGDRESARKELDWLQALGDRFADQSEVTSLLAAM